MPFFVQTLNHCSLLRGTPCLYIWTWSKQLLQRSKSRIFLFANQDLSIKFDEILLMKHDFFFLNYNTLISWHCIIGIFECQKRVLMGENRVRTSRVGSKCCLFRVRRNFGLISLWPPWGLYLTSDQKCAFQMTSIFFNLEEICNYSVFWLEAILDHLVYYTKHKSALHPS